MILLASFLFGVLFATGLALSGMTQPAKVQGFLDVGGAWDPTLMFVMGGAVAVSFVLFSVVLRRRTPILADVFVLPTKKDIDAPLLVGATLFGVGWGLAGYCPGPAVVSLASLSAPVVVFVASMAAGSYIGGKLTPRRDLSSDR